jgi:hypothetical protein
MNAMPYCVGGTVGPKETYVARVADEQAYKTLCNRRYALLCAPRQQGKSSLLARLVDRLTETPGHLVCSFDLEEFSKDTEALWYRDLFKALSGVVGPVVGSTEFKAWPSNYRGFIALLGELEDTLDRKSLFMDIVIDEVASCPKKWGGQFFAGIRAHHEKTAKKKTPRRVTFLFAGAFVPSDLIPKDTSPFNVANPIPLLDFTDVQVLELVELGPWPVDQRTALARQIHEWTGGQPYMTQWFCEHLAQMTGPWHASSVQDSALTFRFKDLIHLPGLQSRLEEDLPALVEVQRIAAEGRIPLTSSKLHHRLELVFGLVKPADGSWAIRNRVYRDYFSHNSSTSSAPIIPKAKPHSSSSAAQPSSAGLVAGPASPPQVFISYSHRDREEEMRGLVRPIHQFEVFWKGLEKAGYAIKWIDHEKVKAGRFEQQILEAIRTSRMAVLLVSPHYLASDFVDQVEIPALLAAEKMGTVEVLVVELAHSTLKHNRLKDYHCFNKDNPLQALPDVNTLNCRLKELCDNILQTLAALA